MSHAASDAAEPADAAPPPEPAPAPEQARPAVPQDHDLFFARLLDEIYLLLDFIATRNDHGLECLEAKIPMEGGSAAGGTGTRQQVLQRIAELQFPPPARPGRDAADVAFLMLVKDRLAQQARPANGMTIAFTEMVLMGSRSSVIAGQAPGRAGLLPSSHRPGLARNAYPELRSYAWWTKWIWRVCIGLLMALALWTAWLTMHVEAGRILLDRLATATRSYQTAAQAVAAADRPVTATIAGVPPPAVQPVADGLIQPLQPPYHLGFCDRALRLQALPRQDAAYFPNLPVFENAMQRSLCSPLWDADREINSARARLVTFIAPSLPRLDFITLRDESSAKTDSREQEWRADDIARLLSRHMLPLAFAVLGAGVSILRDFTQRMHASVLAPRDLPMAFSRLALGIAAGLAMGLFQSDLGVVPELGGITAPAAARGGWTQHGLAFLAGYGLDAVFSFLDDQLRRLRRSTDPAQGSGVAAAGAGRPAGAA
ncbi:hypothetical protein [Pseudoroseomonas cervicalis]|uniref:hypothetical protein n=1 Tax=Teichococcus cervicalis TaxID=204525 RepID=UPI0027838BB9|nr:hypothetical protein [Pseudoroseomonas cervicalis]MDQ1080028.1 hypothetical protein [Pseudoroseomonas cervicalis]